jgi:hypothetical protein
MFAKVASTVVGATIVKLSPIANDVEEAAANTPVADEVKVTVPKVVPFFCKRKIAVPVDAVIADAREPVMEAGKVKALTQRIQ